MTAFDGRTFGNFVAAGTYFLRKYRHVLNDLNVFPVPDGDTGSNMYLTARAALLEARAARPGSLPAVAAAAARGSLLGARGNSGVILAQMLRGFAQSVGVRAGLDARELAAALADAVGAARTALTTPVEGTIVTVAQVAADTAGRLARTETDLAVIGEAVARAANAALERTPEQLSALKEAGVVDAGAAGFCYFIEGLLRFVPGSSVRATAYPRAARRAPVFTPQQVVGEHRYCTEFVLDAARLDAHALRELLAPFGDSLIVAGSRPLLKVHVHTGRPDDVRAFAAQHGALSRVKVEDMARQHRLLVVEAAPQAFSAAVVVPGGGFADIARALGADATIPVRGANPSVEDLLVGVNATLTTRVYLLANDRNVASAAHEVDALTEKDVIVVPTRDVVRGLAVLLALANREALPRPGAIEAAIGGVAAGELFVTGAGAVARIDGHVSTAPSLGDLLLDVVRRLAADRAGVVTLYFGGRQTERDAARYAAELGERVAGVTVEYYFGGQTEAEYWVSFEA